ncbi:MAG: hypothetical protein QXK12_06380 [Candidatus Nezhaarchaeales archaeon]
MLKELDKLRLGLELTRETLEGLKGKFHVVNECLDAIKTLNERIQKLEAKSLTINDLERLRFYARLVSRIEVKLMRFGGDHYIGKEEH